MVELPADVWGDCIGVILAEDGPTIRAVNPRAWIKKTDYHEQDFQSALQIFTAQRADLLAVLEAPAPEDWIREATVTGAGKPLVRFEPWSGHRDAYRLGGQDDAAPAAPATKATVLAYLAFCQHEAAERVPTMVLDAASGFDWLKFSKFELQLYSIRHVQQHVGELMERLGPRACEIDWVGSHGAE